MDSEIEGVEENTRCPKCGSAVSIRQLAVEGDTRLELVYFITCPRGDLDMAVTDQQVVDAASRVVMERLKSGEV